jgi:hypothetical protein
VTANGSWGHLQQVCDGALGEVVPVGEVHDSALLDAEGGDGASYVHIGVGSVDGRRADRSEVTSPATLSGSSQVVGVVRDGAEQVGARVGYASGDHPITAAEERLDDDVVRIGGADEHGGEPDDLPTSIGVAPVISRPTVATSLGVEPAIATVPLELGRTIVRALISSPQVST